MAGSEPRFTSCSTPVTAVTPCTESTGNRYGTGSRHTGRRKARELTDDREQETGLLNRKLYSSWAEAVQWV